MPWLQRIDWSVGWTNETSSAWEQKKTEKRWNLMEATNMINPTVCQIDQAGFENGVPKYPANFGRDFGTPSWYDCPGDMCMDAAVAITMTQLLFLMLTAAVRSFLHNVSQALRGKPSAAIRCYPCWYPYYRDHPTEIKLQISCGCTESITIRHIEPSRTLLLEETHTAVSWVGLHGHGAFYP